jgi:non-homologous end joining protein Ku
MILTVRSPLRRARFTANYSKHSTSSAHRRESKSKQRCVDGASLLVRSGPDFSRLLLRKFEDGYEVAVKELVDAKINHLPVPKDEAPRATSGKVVNLMDALRKSLGERP